MKSSRFLASLVAGCGMAVASQASAYTLSELHDNIGKYIAKNGDAEILQVPHEIPTSHGLLGFPGAEQFQKSDVQAFFGVPPVCGVNGLPPVIYIERAGAFEYRWCDKNQTHVNLEIWKYHNGAYPMLISTAVVPCANAPQPVKQAACN